jgi:gamma-glutamyltranspeptidase/glutathione hydrolase
MAPLHGAVAAGHAVTAETAAQVLRDGGNAFDAAVAAMAVACVAEPVFASPGGGGFVMALEAGAAEPVVIDFFGQTPRSGADPDGSEFVSVFADFGPARQEFHIGHGATAVPGFMPGLAAVHERLCSAPLADLLGPAIAAARAGVAVTPFQASLFAVVRPIVTFSNGARSVFAPGGELLVAGDRFLNPQLADLYEAFGRQGPAFWVGAGSEALLAGQADSGHLRADDIAAYRVEMRRPLETALADATAFLNPPPSAGGAMVAAMALILETEGLDPAGAMALADEARLTHDGDPGRLLDALGITRAGPRPQTPSPPAPRGTTHVSVIDADGNAAAATVTNGEGNGHWVDGFGFMPNNLLGEADLMPRGYNRWAPDVRLASMMAPTILRTGDGGVTALGSGGSCRIRSAIFQTLARLVLDGLEPADAVAAPRIHIEGGHLDFEDLIEAAARDRLTGAFPRHRAWPERSFYFGGVHMVARAAGGAFSGAGDPRRAGVYLEV